MQLASRHDEADEVVEEAFAVLSAKGNTAAIALAKERFPRLQTASPSR